MEASVIRTAVIAFGAAIAIVLLGMGVLWGLDYGFGWKLDIFVKHAGFLQAWIYMLQTIALVATLVYLGAQTRAVERSVTTNTVQLMVSGHRELLGRILEQPQLYDAIGGGDIPEDKWKTVYLSMFFNHGLNAFRLRETGYIDDDWWEAIIRDMKETVGREGMRKWWAHIKDFYPSKYRTFIEQSILCLKGG
jgi:hypothetical protein